MFLRTGWDCDFRRVKGSLSFYSATILQLLEGFYASVLVQGQLVLTLSGDGFDLSPFLNFYIFSQLVAI